MWFSDTTRSVAGAVLLASLLAGCSDMYYDRRDTVTFWAGDALATAQATQTINPWPPASADRTIRGNGVIIASAVERYRTCQVIPPKATSTSGAYGAAAQAAQPGCTPAPPAAATAVAVPVATKQQ